MPSVLRVLALSLTLLAPALVHAQDQTVYAPPAPPHPEEGTNQGGVSLDFTLRYMTDYVYRGVDRSEVGGHEDAPNLQFDSTVSFDLGNYPHPFVSLFANVYNSDPVSRFQEIRPTIGADWTLRPLTLSFGHTSYIYPDRETAANTSEVFARVTFDDSQLTPADRPILSPYVLTVYDYDQNNGWYFEVGVKHDFVIQDTGLVLTAVADIAYVEGFRQQFVLLSPSDSGVQHYDLGLIGTYSLNNVLNLPKRYGDLAAKGYLFYTDGISNKILATTELWGGVGIEFKY